VAQATPARPSERSGIHGTQREKTVTIRRLSFLALLAVTSGSLSAQAQDQIDGAAVFANRCSECHSVQAPKEPVEGERPKLGPSLHGLFGRQAGTLPGYAYSDAMKASGVIWTDETLEEYLKNPKAFIPRNKMPFNGLKREGEVGPLIAWLAEATR
jgi:cytochrome c